MAAVNWVCLVLAFAFIKINVCIKVDPNGIPNGNNTANSPYGHTMQSYAKSTFTTNDTENFTLLGDTELSALERTRRLIPYMAFYVPVSELPINKQYVSKNNNIHALSRPSAAGASTGSTGAHIPIPPQYVHNDYQYLPPSPESLANGQQQNYQPSAGLNIYHAHAHPYGGQHSQQQQQFHLLPPPTTGHSTAILQPPGPPGPSAVALPSVVEYGKVNGNSHNAFVTYKEINPLRQKTVQYFPPLSSTASSASSASSALASTFETLRQTSTLTKQQPNPHKIYHHHHHISTSGSGGTNIPNVAAFAENVGYRPRTKQSKINLTPFTPSNTVPGHFVPIVYTPVHNNNNINYGNNNFNVHNAEEELHDDSSLNQDAQQQQYRKQQQQQQQLLPPHHHQLHPQQIAVEYSSGPLPSTGIAASIPFNGLPHQHHHHNQQQKQNPKQSSQFYSVTTSPVNVDLTHDEVLRGPSGGEVSAISSGDSVNLARHQQQNAKTISPPPTIYHQNQHHHHQLQMQPEHVIIDASLQTAQQKQTVTLIGSQHQQQLIHGGKSATHFQPPKPENFFESEIQQQQQQQQQQRQHIDQVLKDVNSYSLKNSQVLTPQEKYVMYLQQRMRYNKHQQRHNHHYATRQKYRDENDNKTNNVKEHQPNPLQIYVLSSTVSPPQHDSITALAPIRPSQPPIRHDSNYPQHSPTSHYMYPRLELKPSAVGGVNGSESEEQVLTIPVHSLFGDLDILQHHHRQQQPHNHYSQIHSASSSSKHNSPQYFKNRSPPKPHYIDHVFDEPKQSLDDEQHQQNPKQQTNLLKPTLGPPTHAFILVTTAAPFQQEPVTQENYGSSARPPYKTKPKLRLQPLLADKKVNYPTKKTHVVSITPTPKSPQYNENNEKPKYVYLTEEFGQKLSTVPGDGTAHLKPLNKYESDDNQIPQQQQSHYNDSPLQSLEPKPSSETQHNEAQAPPNTPPKTILADPNELPDIRTSSLAEILHKLQESNHLPHTLTPDNIDNSIKTLIHILNNLKQTQTIVANPPQHHELPAHATHPSSPEYDYTTDSEEDQQHQTQPHDSNVLPPPTGPNKHPGPSTGRPGIDYPNYAAIPRTSFDCSQQRYKGFFGDPETNCQVWHYCDLNGGKASFLCPNGTIFSQIALTCDWWFNVKCATTPQLYVLNERLYKYILPFTPKFPEDYSGPIVDKYLAMKFQEMEEKMRLEKEKILQEETEATTETEQPEETVSEASQDGNQLEETTTTANEDNIHVKVHSSTKLHKPESVNSQVSEQSSERNLLIDDEVNDISQRGTVDNFESTTIATISATKTTDTISFSLKPIIVSSTLSPDYDDDHLQQHENEKRSQEAPLEDKETNKTEITKPLEGNNNNSILGSVTEKSIPTLRTTGDKSSTHRMQITVEKVDVIEIKPDGATGHLIRDMLMNSKQTN